MLRTRTTRAAAVVAAALIVATGCGADPASPVNEGATEGGSASATPLPSEAPTPSVPLTDVMPEVDAVIAKDIAQWLTIGKVTSAVVGEVVDVELGPALLEPLAPGPDLSVSTTAVINIRVTESFIGDAKPGDVVQVLIGAGPGRVVAPGEPPPFRPVEGAGISIAEFNKALPAGVQVIAMSNLHPPEQLGSSEALPAIFPPGLEPRQAYMTAVHPQALVVNPVDSESNWAPHTFDELVQQLREAT